MTLKVKPQDLPKGYEPKAVESKWYDFWIKNNYFKADDHSSKPTYSMVMPPPNVTGVLHMGHALNCTIQDILARFKRMQGFNTLWLPGMDHAGISTQIVVEKQLAKDGIKRHQLGREKFVEKIWEWKEKSGGTIFAQQKRLGVSVDWSRSKFTLDEDLSFAVKKVFVDLFNEKLIYRGNRLINWCPRCQTALSDLEVKHVDTKGVLYHIKYLWADGSAGGVEVATTRPETMLGDVAVAVNPKDDRYKKFIGKKLKLPLTDREIPVIADDVVAQEFGTGVVKITPAHDFNDYETGMRHKLPMISIFDKTATINENGFAYKGMKAADARKKVIEDLTALGLFVKEEPHAMSVGKCERTDDVVEPMLSDQWFVKIQPLADRAIKVVEDGDIKFHPENWKKTYLDWLYNIKDWCISRQLWWGHRIPAWHCQDCQFINVSMDEVKKCSQCGKNNLKQDEDVLDTWFSSWLWPMSTLGWPDDTQALKTFYPTNVLVTGFDIIFFWVARMVMAGLHFKKAVPFKDVYIHGLVRDEGGKKMSKSKGNAVDPLDLVNDYGTDALRFTLAAYIGAGRDIKFSEDRLDGYRNFINKIWNATRFALTALEEVEIKTINPSKLTLPDKYIIYELKKTVDEVTRAFDEYRFTDAVTSLYKFTWNEFCDWYLELSKPVLYGTDAGQKSQSGAVLLGVLERLVKLLHPVIPFVTEEIYQLLPGHGESICIQQYPNLKDEFLKLGSENSAREIETIKSVVTAVRNIRGEMGISPAIKLNCTVGLTDSYKSLSAVLMKNEVTISALARLEKFDVTQSQLDGNKSAVKLVFIDGHAMKIVIPLEAEFIEKEKARVMKDLEKINKDFELVNKKLNNPTFVQNAPKEIIDQENERIRQFTEKKKELNEALQRLS